MDADAADDEGIDALDGGEEDGFAAAPWPWSLVGSNAVEDNYAWYAEAEWKHGRIALLALANWLALCAAGQVGLDSEPLTSLANPVPAALWSTRRAASRSPRRATSSSRSTPSPRVRGRRLVLQLAAVALERRERRLARRRGAADRDDRAMPAAMAERLAEREGPGHRRRRRRRRRGRLGGGGGRGGGRGHPPRLPGRVDRARPLRDAAMATLALNADLEKGVLNDLLFSKGLEIGFEAPMAAREPRFEAPVANAETFGSAAERKSAESELLVSDISQLATCRRADERLCVCEHVRLCRFSCEHIPDCQA